MIDFPLLVIPVFIAHRGCPYQCLFCNQYAITGKGDATSGDPDIAGIIAQWLARSPGYDRVQVAFYGGSFTCLDSDVQERMLGKVQPFIRTGRVHSVRLSTRPDCINREIVTRLKENGVATVELGVQSMDDRVLMNVMRGHSASDCWHAARLLREGGIGEVGVQLLPGLPGETTNSFLDGVRQVIAMEPDLVRLYPAVVVNRSGLEKMYRGGDYKPMSLHRAVALCRRARELFSGADIPVVRMGLQPSEALEKELVAGPFHPAFGELVLSRQWFRELRGRLMMLEPGEHLTVRVSHRDYSALVGRKKMNMRRLAQLGFDGLFSIVQEQKRERGSVTYVVD